MNNTSGLYSVYCDNALSKHIYVKGVDAGHIHFVDREASAGLFDFATAGNIRIDLILKGYRNPKVCINASKRNHLLTANQYRAKNG